MIIDQRPQPPLPPSFSALFASLFVSWVLCYQCIFRVYVEAASVSGVFLLFSSSSSSSSFFFFGGGEGRGCVWCCEARCRLRRWRFASIRSVRTGNRSGWGRGGGRGLATVWSYVIDAGKEFLLFVEWSNSFLLMLGVCDSVFGDGEWVSVILLLVFRVLVVVFVDFYCDWVFRVLIRSWDWVCWGGFGA